MTKLLLPSPVGPLLVEHGAESVWAIRFWPQGEHPPAGTRDEPARGDPLGRQIARELGRPGASRAVGQANARNPLPVVVPCHRVLAADGGLGGYLGAWGEHTNTAVKRWLLEHEGALLPPSSPPAAGRRPPLARPG